MYIKNGTEIVKVFQSRDTCKCGLCAGNFSPLQELLEYAVNILEREKVQSTLIGLF